MITANQNTKDVTNLGEAIVPIDEATFRRLELVHTMDCWFNRPN